MLVPEFSFEDSIVFSMYTVMSSESSDSFPSLFLMIIPLDIFSLLLYGGKDHLYNVKYKW